MGERVMTSISQKTGRIRQKKDRPNKKNRKASQRRIEKNVSRLKDLAS
jgi:hypothetical protein